MIKFFNSFRHAWNGIVLAIQSERNLRIHFVAALLVTSLGLLLDISPTEWMIQTFVIGIVVGAELLNTAIEKFVDFVSPDYREEVGHVKDISSGAVLFIAIMAAIVGIMIYLPYFLKI